MENSVLDEVKNLTNITSETQKTTSPFFSLDSRSCGKKSGPSGRSTSAFFSTQSHSTDNNTVA